MTEEERKKLESYFSKGESALYKLLKNNKKNKDEPKLKDFIRYTRETLGYTQQEFANWLNIKQNTLSRYENGIRPVPIELFMDLCYELGYEIVIEQRKDMFGEKDWFVKEHKEERNKWKEK